MAAYSAPTRSAIHAAAAASPDEVAAGGGDEVTREAMRARSLASWITVCLGVRIFLSFRSGSNRLIRDAKAGKPLFAFGVFRLELGADVGRTVFGLLGWVVVSRARA